MIEKLRFLYSKLFRSKSSIERRDTSLLYQYIEDVHALVINTIGIDPIAHPIKFQVQLRNRWEEISLKIEDLKKSYMDLISKDSQFGESLKNYDSWYEQREAWIKRKVKLDVAKNPIAKQ